MTEMSPMEPYGRNDIAVADYRDQSRDFLAQARQYLADDDLHQAAEKGWGAAAWMVKAVAEAQGWRYKTHDEYFKVMYQAEDRCGDARLRNLRRVPTELHGFFYTRKTFLRPDVIDDGLNQVELMLDILQPLSQQLTQPPT